MISLLLLSTLFMSATQLMAQPPNIIIILTDDQGYGDVGFNGCADIPTPNIDRIAGHGVRFTNGYVSYAVCGPSRAGLITGRYQDRFGFGRNPILAPEDPRMGLPLSEETLARVLGRAGYRSMAIGKWHLGAHETLHPLKRGFDEFYGFLSGGHRYFPEEWTLQDLSEIQAQFDGYRTKLLRNYERVEESAYLTDALSREAVEFVGRNPSSPFFLYLAYNAPHSPLQATEKYLSRFAHIQDKKRRTYAAMVSAVDDGVGNLLDRLEMLGLDDNTIVFFLSDNGGPEKTNGSDNGPLRGQKGDLWEGGIRVPFAVQWRGKVPAGVVYERPVISLDIFATAVAQAQAEISPERPLDGVDLIPFLQPGNEEAPHTQLYWRKFDAQSEALVDQSGYKYLVEKKETTPALYELSQDIGEENNLATQQKRRTKRLRKAYQRWLKELMDPTFMGLMQRQAYYEKMGLERTGE
jgi:arylsulfatase A-like enzyme